MKTIQRNRSLKAVLGGTLCGALLLTAASCDLPSGLGGDVAKTEREIEQIGALQLSYDQQTHRFTTHWPASVIGEGLASETEGQVLLEHYEYVHEVLTIGEDGTVETETEWVDGHAEMGLPAELYQLTEEERPALPNSHQQVKKSTLKDGMIRYLDESGGVLYEFPVEEDSLTVDSEWLEEFLAGESDSTETEQRIAQNLQQLQQSGLSFRLDGETIAIVEREISDGDVAKVRSRIDLASGLVTSVRDLDSAGRLLRSESMHYEKHQGFPVLKNKMVLQYGEREGVHTLLTRTLIHRDNINLIKL